MIGMMHLVDTGDRYTLKRDVHVPCADGTMMCVAAGMSVNLLCVLVYPSGY